MGANLSGPRDNTKDPNLNKCSDAVWDGEQGDEAYMEKVKKDLEANDAYIKLDKFCGKCGGNEQGSECVIGDQTSFIEVHSYGQNLARVYGSVEGMEDWYAGIPNRAYERDDGFHIGESPEAQRNKFRREGYPPNRAYQACTSIGDPVEWMPFRIERSGCAYNSCNGGFSVQGPATNGVCSALNGDQMSCARVAFKGDPTVCCFNDYECNKEANKCFQTPERQRTCDPLFRDLAGVICRTQIEKYCTGEILFPTQTNWLEMWVEDSQIEINSEMSVSDVTYRPTFYSTEVSLKERGKKFPLREKQPCLRAIARNVTKQKICSWEDLEDSTVITGNLDAEGLEWGRKIITSVVQRYLEENGASFLEGINKEGVTNSGGFYNTIWKICNKIPLLCTNGSEENAEGILPDLCKEITPDNISDNPNVVRWCACHMPDEEYKNYKDKFNISKQCTSICNREGVIPVINTDGERKICIQNLCVLDDSNFNISNTQFGEDSELTFRQLCPGCGKGNVTRRFTYQHYREESKTSEGDPIYSIPEAYSFNSTSETYENIYGYGYDIINFPNDTFTVSCLYTTKEFLRTGGYPPYGSNSLSSQDDAKNLPRINVKFGLLEGKEGIIGVVNVVTMSGGKIDEYEDFVVVFLSTTVNKNHKKLQLRDDLSETVFYAGDTQAYTSQPYNNNLVLVKTKDFIGQTTEYVNDLKFSSEESFADANVCQCFMDEYNLEILNSRFSGSINFTQECGKSECRDSKGEIVSCASSSADPAFLNSLNFIERATAELEIKEKYSSIFNILIAVSAFFLIAYLIYMFINR